MDITCSTHRWNYDYVLHFVQKPEKGDKYEDLGSGERIILCIGVTIHMGFWIRHWFNSTLTALTILDYDVHYLAQSLIRKVCSWLHTHCILSVCCPFTSILVTASNGGRSPSWVPEQSSHHNQSYSWLTMLSPSSGTAYSCPDLYRLELCPRATSTSSVELPLRT
jgi:hypothetical protein